MQPICKPHTELPHSSKLFTDLLYHYERVSSFYPYPPFRLDSYEKAAQSVDFSKEQRENLVRVLSRQNDAKAALDRLASGAYAVVTGQQIGLFSGPAFTIYKALSAVKLAEQLTKAGIPAVPVFWVATEDHDFQEVASCWTFTSGAAGPVRLMLSPAEPVDRPVGSIPLIDPPVEALRQALSGFPYAEQVSALVKASYQPGRTLGEAFTQLLKSLLQDFDILFFDPLDPASRSLAAPLLRQAVDAAPELIALLLARNKELSEAGYHAQIHIERDTALFFLLEEGRRLAMRSRDSGYVVAGEWISAKEARDRAESLSPSAALRPIVQDYIFPTIGYVGGPAELAYLAQSAVLYRALLGRMPVITPRNGFTLVDPRGAKLMKRYGLGLEAFFGGQERLREQIAARLVPPQLEARFQQTQSEVEMSLSKLRSSLDSFDSTLGRALDHSGAKIRYQLEKIRRKTARESLRRSERARADSAYLFERIFPHKNLQERFYTCLPFLAEHGLELVSRLYGHTNVDCPDHHLLFL